MIKILFVTNIKRIPKVKPIRIGPDISDSLKNLSSHFYNLATHKILSFINSIFIPKSNF